MVKKALCVGCNYPSKAFGLAGAVNDAFLLAECLQKNCGFDPENVCVLHDIYPGQKKSMKVDPSKRPTRVNILARLQWLVRSARAGDVLVFSFSGYGLQVDDMDGYQDEGYDEAILPTDFVDGRDGDYTVIVTDDIHDILMGIPNNCTAIVIMDCDHATSVIDVSGTVDGKLVSGLKFNTFCGLKAHTTKVERASHNRDVWQEEKARALKARPRFQPMMEIDNPRKGRLPTRLSMSRSTPIAFCYSAAGYGQTAMEMQVNRMIDGKEQPRQQGILTWCFVQALEELRYNCTHLELQSAITRHLARIRATDLPKMDQEVLLTFSTPHSNPSIMRVFQPPGLPSRVLSGQGMEQGSPINAPPVVPPPPPGFLASQGGACGSSAPAPGGYGGPPGGGGGAASRACPEKSWDSRGGGAAAAAVGGAGAGSAAAGARGGEAIDEGALPPPPPPARGNSYGSGAGGPVGGYAGGPPPPPPKHPPGGGTPSRGGGEMQGAVSQDIPFPQPRAQGSGSPDRSASEEYSDGMVPGMMGAARGGPNHGSGYYPFYPGHAPPMPSGSGGMGAYPGSQPYLPNQAVPGSFPVKGLTPPNLLGSFSGTAPLGLGPQQSFQVGGSPQPGVYPAHHMGRG